MIYMFTGPLFVGPFIDNELKIFADIEEKMLLIPSDVGDISREKTLPSNVKVDYRLYDAKKKYYKDRFCYFKTLFSKEFISVFFSHDRPKTLKNIKKSIVAINYALLVKKYVSKNIKPNKNDVIYTFWLNEDALGTMFYIKEKGGNFNFISRAHRYDVYEERVGTYLPYRAQTLKYVDNVYVVSNAGATFLKDRYKEYSDKILVEHLGVFIYKSTKNSKECDSSTISLLSCSNVIPVKRVDLIYKSIVEYSLKHKDKTIEWTHIGAGSLFSELQELVKNVPENMKVNLLGRHTPQEVINILKNDKFDVFINISLSEGIPVSIMEALSFNIPIVATDAGGNGEIVNSESGVLIPISFNQDEFCAAIDNCIDKSEEYKKSIPEYFNRNFNAEINYCKFYNMILKNNDDK